MTTPSTGRRVVFVCAGNICRSPVALHAFHRALLRRSFTGAPTASFGLVAGDGDVPCEETLRAARSAGLDLSAHAARRLAPALLRPDDLIFVMEQSQRAAVQAMAPAATVVLLGSLLPEGPVDIADPEGGNEAVFHACVTRIVACVEQLVADSTPGPHGWRS